MQRSKSIFISTSIPYVNGHPHIGHAFELVQSDCLARAYRAAEYQVFFSTGTDDNAQKNVESAAKASMGTAEFVEMNAKRFHDLQALLNLTCDGFIRTSSPLHAAGAQAFWKRCLHDIYKKSYFGLYCIGCETFYKDGEFPDNICPDHNRTLDVVTEENYFFPLSKYQTQIHELISNGIVNIVPDERRNEILKFIEKGLEDFSISRPASRMKGWGIPVPGDPTQHMYVWFDALTNYLTVLGFDTSDAKFTQYWNESAKRIHMIGKDITKFHAIYWIGMLLSAKIAHPTDEFVHGFITSEGIKMSKTLGNVVDPVGLVKSYGVDAVRYYLLKEIPATSDGDFSHARMRQLYTSDLANELGNLVSRVTTLAHNDGLVLPEQQQTAVNQKILDYVFQFDFSIALSDIWDDVKAINIEMNKVKPWELASDDRKKHLSDWLTRIHQIGADLKPFLPDAAGKIIEATGGPIQKVSPLFPRLVQ